MAGAVGLKYDVLWQLLDRKGYTGEAWWQMFDEVKILECEALAAMHPKET